MMKNAFKIVLILLLFFSTTNLTSFIPTVEAETVPSRMLGKLSTFGDREYDYFNSVTATSDGHVAVGYSDSTEGELIGLNKGYRDAIIVNYDKNDKIKWTKTFGGSSGDAFNSVAATSNGYVAVGYSASHDTDLTLQDGMQNAIIVNYDKEGKVEWKKELGNVNSDNSFNSVAATSDGFVTAGYSNNDAVIVKYDTSGNQIWLKRFGGSESDRYHSVIATSDGYVVVGETASEDGDIVDNNRGVPNALIVKYDLDGNVMWKKTYDNRFVAAYRSIVATDDGYLVAGMDWYDALIVKYDLDGNVKWKKTFGGSYTDVFNSVTTTSDGFIAVGDSTSTDHDLEHLNKGGQDAIMVKYDHDGHLLWKKTVGGSRYDVFNAVTETEQGVIAVGYSTSYDGDLRAIMNGETDAMILDLRMANQIEPMTLDYSARFRLLTINPEDEDETFEWTSSNSSIIPLYFGEISVTGYGSVVLEGTSSKNSEDKITIPIQVNEYVKVTISPEETLLLTTGTTSKLTALVTPVDATNQNINWTSSNPSIATVDSMGNVTAISRGKAVITATSEVGHYEAKVKVQVSLPYYKVSFDSKGGTAVSDVFLEAGSLIDRPERPTKTGYVFGGWYKEESLTNEWNTYSDKVESDTTLFAKWYIRTYPVYFNSNGGTPINPKTTNENTIITAPTAPKRTGYTFVGWYKENGTTPWNFSTDKVTANTTLYAKWTINRYTVNFNSNGGSKVNPKTTNYNTIITAPTAPKRIGYTFVGWYKDSSGKIPWNFSTDKVTGNTTLYAKWTINRYTVNFNSNGGSKVNPKTTNYNTIITAPTAPKRTGYTFVGWYKDSSGKTPWNFSKDKVTAKTTLYAKWVVTPAVPKSILVNKLSSKSIKISWSRVSGASGYDIYRATKSNGKYSYIKSTTALYYTNTNLRRGTTYYYKVRSYRLVGTKKVYSGWSVIKSAKL